jgi:ESCRT-II complex subunit VPS22
MATRRGVGLGAFANRTQATQSYASHGAALRSSHLNSLQTQLSVFQQLLHSFALEHASTIKSDPIFRAEFARMCNAIGVDPLAASNVKGKKGEGGSFWTQTLGGDVNDFYFEVAVRVVELCRETRGENGGLIGVQECRERVAKGKGIGGDLKVSEYVNTGQICLVSNELTSPDLVTTSFALSNPSSPSAPASLLSILAASK